MPGFISAQATRGNRSRYAPRPTGAIVGDTYASVDDAQQAVANNYQVDSGTYTGNVTGSLACADPSAPTTRTMMLRVTSADGPVVSGTGSATFKLDGLSDRCRTRTGRRSRDGRTAQVFHDSAWDRLRKRRAIQVRTEETREAKELLKQANQIDAIARELHDEGNPRYAAFATEASRRRNIQRLSNRGRPNIAVTRGNLSPTC